MREFPIFTIILYTIGCWNHDFDYMRWKTLSYCWKISNVHYFINQFKHLKGKTSREKMLIRNSTEIPQNKILYRSLSSSAHLTQPKVIRMIKVVLLLSLPKEFTFCSLSHSRLFLQYLIPKIKGKLHLKYSKTLIFSFSHSQPIHTSIT